MSFSKILFWIGLTLVMLVFLVGYVNLIARTDHHADRRAEGRAIYRNQMGWDRNP